MKRRRKDEQKRRQIKLYRGKQNRDFVICWMKKRKNNIKTEVKKKKKKGEELKEIRKRRTDESESDRDEKKNFQEKKQKTFCSKTNLKISCKARECIKQFFIPSMNFKMASKNIEKFKSRTPPTHTEIHARLQTHILKYIT